MIGVHGHDVIVSADRPEGPVIAFRGVMDRCLGPQPLEVGPDRVLTKEFGTGRIEGFKRFSIGLGPRLVSDVDGSVTHARRSFALFTPVFLFIRASLRALRKAGWSAVLGRKKKGTA